MPAVPGVKPPAPLQVGPEIKADWIRWKEDWSDYAQVQELNAKPYPTQVALFRIALGTEGKRLLRNQPVSQSRNGDGDLVNDNLERTGTLMKMMDSAVNGEINDTYERFVFTHRTQKRGETFDEYLTALKELRKTCNICDCMYDTLLKDQIINGITDSSLQEKLLQKRGLSLNKCIDACRAAESAAKQVKEMSQSEVNRVDLHPGNRAQRRDRPMLQVRSRTQPAGEASAPSQDKKQCRFCGRYHAFQPGACPARTRKCNKCGKTGHFAAKCHARNPRRAVNQVADDSSNEGADLGDYLQSDIGTVNPTGIEVAAVSSSRKAIMRVQGKKKAFLIDTGAGANLISAHDVDTSMLKLHTPGRTFHMWNGSEQRSLGRAPIKLYNPKQKRVFVLNFDIVPDKLTPILGSAAAQAMDLVTIHDENFERVAAVLPEPPSREEYVEKYPDVFKSQLGKLEGTVGLQVDPDITPVSLPARQVPIALRRSMKEELERLQKLEVITPVTKPTNWVSQAVIIQKPDKSIRLCIDPRPLNKALKRERFHLTTFEELLPNLAGAKVFTKVDLKSGYWHVVLDEDASDLTATATPYGRFKWKRLPFGLSVSSEIFGRKIREAFDGLEGVHCIADDAIIAGVGSDMAEAMKSHETRLNAFLQRCQRKGIVLNANKFELRVPSVVFMGHVLGTDGIRPDPAKVKAIVDMPNPVDVSATRRFLGIINYLAKFVPNLTSIVRPIQALISQDVIWTWGKEQDDAMKRVKAIISSEPVLAHFDETKQLVVQCDASQNGLGAALLQEGRPLAYASRALTPSEQNYAQIEKELLSVLFAMQRFHQYTYGRHVIVENDHKPLEIIDKKPLARAPGRLQRILLRLLNYSYRIVHVPGRNLLLADALSRAYVKDEHPEEFNFDTVNSVIVADLTDEELKEMREHTLHDKQLASLLRTVKEGWPNAKKDCPPELTPFWDFRDEISASQQILIKGQMIFVPTSLRKKYIKLTHNAHQGADACIRRARESIFWPSMAADIRAYVERCEICARAAPRQQKQPLQQPDTPNKAWDTVAADIFTTNGKDYLVTVDSLSGYFEVDRLRTLTAAETIQKLRIIFARYGSPRFLFTDNGRQFASTEFRDFTRQWRVDHRTSSPHYPRSNGQAEAAVKVAKSIMKKANEERGDVYKALLDYRNTPRTTTGLSPVQVLMQRKTRTASLPQQIPASASDRQAKQAKQKRQQQVKTHHDKTAAELKPIGCGTNVWFMEWQGSRETWSKGTVTGAHDKGRSYFITTSSGRKFRRNRVHIRPDTTTTDDEDDDDTVDDNYHTTTETRPRSLHGHGFVPPATTRYGRVIKPVTR